MSAALELAPHVLEMSAEDAAHRLSLRVVRLEADNDRLSSRVAKLEELLARYVALSQECQALMCALPDGPLKSETAVQVIGALTVAARAAGGGA